MLRGKIDGLKRNIAMTEKLSNDAERLDKLKRLFTETEAELQRITDSKIGRASCRERV